MGGGLALRPISFVIIVLLALGSQNARVGVNCIGLDPDGGYNIVVGISDEWGSATEDPLAYIQEVKLMISDFASLLWSSTTEIFYIKSVQIVVPADWGSIAELGSDISVGANYGQADIQITNATEVPHAENYHPCGRPGLRIQLPVWFTDSAYIEGLYGSQSKGLLNLWLRYRFGVWEEYGYPGHPTTPYVYNENDIEHSPWRLTKCTNTPLNGDFEYYDFVEQKDRTCSTDGALFMLRDCRFKVVSSQYVTSSVMNFQWIFANSWLCDEDTHDKRVPNRQNLYCGHKSVWEVIRESPDFKKISTTPSRAQKQRAGNGKAMPEIHFKILAPSPKPHLYMLLDLSAPAIRPNTTMHEEWVTRMVAFVDVLPSDIVATLVAYPKLNSTSFLDPLVDWTLLDDEITKPDMKEAFNFSAVESTRQVDFRQAMYEATSELKTRNHPNGAILLFLRNEDAVNPDTYPTSALFEDDFLLDFKQYGIILFGISINIHSFEERPVFEYLASETGGKSALIRVGDNPANKMNPVLEGIWVKLGEILPSNETEYEIIYKDIARISHGVSVQIPKRSDVDWIHIHVTLQAYASGMNYIRFQLPDPTDPFSERVAWAQNETWVPRGISKVYSKKFKVFDLEEHAPLFWELYLCAENEILEWLNQTITAMVLVYGSRTKVRSGSKEVVGLSNRIIAEISTSALDNKYDGCNSTEGSVEPLAIYVKLRNALGLPVLLLNSDRLKPVLLGKLMHLETSEVLSVGLYDSGKDADLLDGDGVYSGYIYPNDISGYYRLYVDFTDFNDAESDTLYRTMNPIGRIPSVAQDDLEVTILRTTLNTPYSVVFESTVSLHSMVGCEGKRFIPRVTDTQVRVTELDAEIVRVSFTVPFMTSSLDVPDEGNEWEQYYMGLGRFAQEIGTLIDDVSKGEMTVFIIPMAMAGQQVSVFLPRNESLAFAFELLDFGQSPTKSLPSNIVRIEGWRPDDQDDGGSPDDKACDLHCVIYIAAGCGVIILILVVISCCLWRRSRRQQKQLTVLSRDEVKEFLHGHAHSAGKPEGSKARKKFMAGPVPAQPNEYMDTERIQSLPYDSKYEIPSNKLHIDKTELIGSGTFGNVYKGYVVNMPGATGKVLVVAVKTMKPDMDKSCFKALLTEVKLMTHIGNTHPNIVKLVGACTKNIRKCEVFLATSFCENGSLSSYLLKLNESNFKSLIDETGTLEICEQGHIKKETEIATTWTLIKWAREIANGMTFLGQKKIVHGDLAARNILLDSALVAKISDFGLSKQMLKNYNYGSYGYQTEVEVEGGGLLPWKWLAPEALTYMKFSVASDVWAYGVTVWEIFSLGQVPYPGIKWSADFVAQLEKGGLRLGKPNFATDAIYEIMCDCWSQDPKMRAGFNQIKNDFDQMLIVSGPGEYLTLK